MSEFGRLLKNYRRNSQDPTRGGPLTQARLVELLEELAGLSGYPDNQVSYWENHRSIPHTERHLLIGLIRVLHHCGGIKTLAEANHLLRAGKYSDMSEAEAGQVNSAWQSATHTESTKPAPVSPTIDNEPVRRTPEQLSSFVAGPPITAPRQFFGRTLLLKRLFAAWVTFPLEHAAIIGLQRSGKTSLLHYIKNITRADPRQLRSGQRHDWLSEPENHRWILVDFQDSRMCNLERLLQYLLTQLDLSAPDPCSLEQFMDIVSYQIQQPTIILMDELGAALAAPELNDAFWDNLRSLANNYANGNLGYVVTAHTSLFDLTHTTAQSSPFFNIFRTFKLGPLEEQEARALIASSPRPFAPVDVEWILAESRLWPSLVQLFCKIRLAAGEEEEAKIWQAECRREIERFHYLIEAVP